MAPVDDNKLAGLVAATFTPFTSQGWVVFVCPLSVSSHCFVVNTDWIGFLVLWTIPLWKVNEWVLLFCICILCSDYLFPSLCWLIFILSQNSEINLMEIGPYIDYLIEKQGIKNIFGRVFFFFGGGYYVFWILNHAWIAWMKLHCLLLVLVLVVLPVF